MHIQTLFSRIETYSHFRIKLHLKVVFLLKTNLTKSYQHILEIASLSLQIHMHTTQDGLI